MKGPWRPVVLEPPMRTESTVLLPSASACAQTHTVKDRSAAALTSGNWKKQMRAWSNARLTRACSVAASKPWGIRAHGGLAEENAVQIAVDVAVGSLWTRPSCLPIVTGPHDAEDRLRRNNDQAREPGTLHEVSDMHAEAACPTLYLSLPPPRHPPTQPQPPVGAADDHTHPTSVRPLHRASTCSPPVSSRQTRNFLCLPAWPTPQPPTPTPTAHLWVASLVGEVLPPQLRLLLLQKPALAGGQRPQSHAQGLGQRGSKEGQDDTCDVLKGRNNGSASPLEAVHQLAVHRAREKLQPSFDSYVILPPFSVSVPGTPPWPPGTSATTRPAPGGERGRHWRRWGGDMWRTNGGPDMGYSREAHEADGCRAPQLA